MSSGLRVKQITEHRSNSYQNMSEYIGKMMNGQMHGPGKLIYENGEHYAGEFVNGKRYGEGGRVLFLSMITAVRVTMINRVL